MVSGIPIRGKPLRKDKKCIVIRTRMKHPELNSLHWMDITDLYKDTGVNFSWLSEEIYRVDDTPSNCVALHTKMKPGDQLDGLISELQKYTSKRIREVRVDLQCQSNDVVIMAAANRNDFDEVVKLSRKP